MSMMLTFLMSLTSCLDAVIFVKLMSVTLGGQCHCGMQGNQGAARQLGWFCVSPLSK